MKKLHLKDWRDLDRQEVKATFGEVRKVNLPDICYVFTILKKFAKNPINFFV